MLKKSLWLAASLTTISGIAIADTVYVTDDGDTGPYTFRSAVEAANANPDIKTIQFDFTSPPTIELESAVVYTGAELHIQGRGSTLSGGSVPAETGTWNSGLFVAKGCASLTIEDLAFEKSFNNGLAVFLGSEDSEYSPCSNDVSIVLNNLSVSKSQFFGVLIDGQKTTGFNTDDIIHHACKDPWPYDANAMIFVTVTDSEIVQNGLPDGGVDGGADDPSLFDISLHTGCPQDFDGLRVDQGGDGDIHAELDGSHFDHNLADGVELDEKGDGSVYAEVEDSTFNHNGDTVTIECTADAVADQVFYEDEDTCKEGDDVQDLDDGFDIDEEGIGNMIAQVIDTEVNGNHDEGLDFDEADAGSIDVLVENVTAIQNEDEALKASEEDDGDVTVVVMNSSFKHGGDDGTQLEEEDDGDIYVEVKDSAITHNAKAGVKVEESNNGSGELTIEDTDLRRNDESYDTNLPSANVELINVRE